MHHPNDNDPHDALNDYLDSLAGASPPDSRAGDLDPGMRDDVDRFFDLARDAGMTPRAKNQSGRPNMNAILPASTALPAPQRNTRRGITLPAWTRHLHFASTGLLIIVVIALSFAAFGPNGPGRGGNDPGDGSSLNGVLPIATVPDDASIETSSFPYPGPEECTVEVTREELIADIQEANLATEPELQQYERPIEPTNEETQAIMQTYREWQACGWDTQGYGLAYEIQLQTPWYTANFLPVFLGYDESLRPVSDEKIEDYADVLLQPEDTATPPAPVDTPPPMPKGEPSELLPVPSDGTPVASQGGRAFPTILAEDIVITGPDTAEAPAYFVNETPAEITPSTPLNYEFIKVDGQWLINDYHEGSLG